MAAGIATAGLLLDSNILIDLLRGEAQALAWLEAHGARLVATFDDKDALYAIR